MEVGPAEYVILGFPGEHFPPEVAAQLGRLVDGGLVRIIDLVFIRKAPDGQVTSVEFDELPDLAPFAALEGDAGELFSDEDFAYTAACLEPGSSAMLVVWEDLWAVEFARSLRGVGGTVLEGARIPREIADAAFAPIATG